jgi:hypothetical protein
MSTLCSIKTVLIFLVSILVFSCKAPMQSKMVGRYEKIGKRSYQYLELNSDSTFYYQSYFQIEKKCKGKWTYDEGYFVLKCDEVFEPYEMRMTECYYGEKKFVGTAKSKNRLYFSVGDYSLKRIKNEPKGVGRTPYDCW